MPSKRPLPFQNLGMREKQNLGLAALLTFYVVLYGWQILTTDLVYGYGADFLAFWSGGQIANTQGYEKVYDIQTLDQVQREIIQKEDEFAPLPVALFPVFVAPFQLLANLDFTVSFWIWTSVNLVAFVLYLYFFLSKWVEQVQPRLVLMLALSFPFFFTLLEGQMNVWIAIAVGEFIRAFLDEKPFRAGLWLGGLLLKPQTLILIGPFLLIKGLWKTLSGFTVTALVVFLSSLLLAGWQGIKALLMLWFNFAEGIPTNGPENMMNWRMISIRLGGVTTYWIGWLVAGLGIVFCLVMTWKLWRNINLKSGFPQHIFVWVVLGTLAATCAVTWHSHLHMGMILIPPIAYLYAQGDFEDRYLNFWLFLPLVTFIFIFFLGALINDPYILVAGHAGGFILGFCALFLNLMLLVVSYRQTKIFTSAL